MYFIVIQKKKNHIRRIINTKKRNIYMRNQYYYFDLMKIQVGWACITEN